MQTQEEERVVRKNWVLDKWYEKAVYVFGVIYTALLGVAFVIGAVGAILD